MLTIKYDARLDLTFNLAGYDFYLFGTCRIQHRAERLFLITGDWIMVSGGLRLMATGDPVPRVACFRMPVRFSGGLPGAGLHVMVRESLFSAGIEPLTERYDPSSPSPSKYTSILAGSRFCNDTARLNFL